MSCSFERSGEKAFHHFKYALLLRETHLQIDLSKLRLAVSTQIFVAEAAHDLKIFIEAADHQYLLEQLRRLRQCIELSRMHTAGHQIIAGAFWRAACHERCFYLKESARR